MFSILIFSPHVCETCLCSVFFHEMHSFKAKGVKVWTPLNIEAVVFKLFFVITQDLQHPNEFIRGSTLRFLCKLKESELLEPLMPAIRACLEHRHSYVRRNAVLAIYTIYRCQMLMNAFSHASHRVCILLV